MVISSLYPPPTQPFTYINTGSPVKYPTSQIHPLTLTWHSSKRRPPPKKKITFFIYSLCSKLCHLCLPAVSVSFLISTFSLWPDCINTFILKLVLCCGAFLPLGWGNTEERKQLYLRCPVPGATTLPPPCLSEHLFAMQIGLFFFMHLLFPCTPSELRQEEKKKPLLFPM